MKLSAFHFELPEERIAKHPIHNKEDTRLMVVDRFLGTIEHFTFKDLPTFFKENDLLVLNDTKVFNARISAKKTNVPESIQVLLLRSLNSKEHLWDVLIHPARKMRIGNKLDFQDGLSGELVDNTTSRGRTLKFKFDGDKATLKELLASKGRLPILEILNRKANAMDRLRFQTVYAKHADSICPPSAGFPFSKYLLKYLEAQGINLAMLTVHISLNSLKKVNVEDFKKYKMHAEYYSIPEETATKVNKAMKGNHRICAVGTSTLKALESSVAEYIGLIANEGWTNKFIHPPYQPKVANALLTGFHKPNSIDFVSTLAFAGTELTMEIYQTALAEKYRFLCYGDSLLII